MDKRSFASAGFLSRRLGGRTRAARKKHANWFKLVERINQVGMRRLRTARPAAGSNKQLLAALLFRRALQSSQGAVLLGERGLAADARTLARSSVESAIILAGLASLPGFEARIMEAHDRHRRAAGNALLRDPEAQKEITQEHRVKLKQMLADVERRYPKGPRDIDYGEVAEKSGFLMIYNTVYRATSGDAAHPMIDALMRHFDAGAPSAEECALFEPDWRELEDTLSASAAAVLHAMEPLSRIFGATDLESDIRKLLNAWRRLALPTEAAGK